MLVVLRVDMVDCPPLCEVAAAAEGDVELSLELDSKVQGQLGSMCWQQTDTITACRLRCLHICTTAMACVSVPRQGAGLVQDDAD